MCLSFDAVQPQVKKANWLKESALRGRAFFFRYPDIFPRVGSRSPWTLKLHHWHRERIERLESPNWTPFIPLWKVSRSGSSRHFWQSGEDFLIFISFVIVLAVELRSIADAFIKHSKNKKKKKKENVTKWKYTQVSFHRIESPWSTRGNYKGSFRKLANANATDRSRLGLFRFKPDNASIKVARSWCFLISLVTSLPLDDCKLNWGLAENREPVDRTESL